MPDVDWQSIDEEDPVAWLLEYARRVHKGIHDAAPPGGCRLCIDREIRALVRDAKDKLSPDDFRHVRWAVRVELGGS